MDPYLIAMVITAFSTLVTMVVTVWHRLTYKVDIELEEIGLFDIKKEGDSCIITLCINIKNRGRKDAIGCTASFYFEGEDFSTDIWPLAFYKGLMMKNGVKYGRFDSAQMYFNLSSGETKTVANRVRIPLDGKKLIVSIHGGGPSKYWEFELPNDFYFYESLMLK